MLANSSVSIQFPSDIVLADLNNSVLYSYTHNVMNANSKFAYSSDLSTIKVSKLFDSTSQSEFVLDTFSIYITNVTTPRSTAPTATFIISILDSLGNTQYYRNSQITSSVVQASQFKAVYIARSSV